MGKALPYFRWYPKDAETDENFRAMSDAEIGFYMRCLNHSWLNNGLPADSLERANVLRSPRAYADKMWKRVGRCFEAGEGGRLFNPRQEEERAEAQAKSKTAKASASRRWSVGIADALRSDMQTHMPTHCEGNARASGSECNSSSVVLRKEEKPEVSLPAVIAFDEQFLQFREACLVFGMNVVDPEDFIDARFAWGALDGLQRAEAIAGIVSRHEAGTDPRYVPKPKNYLKNREWKRKLNAPDRGMSAEEIAAL